MLQKQNKRAVSEVIGYVLLIVIAVGLSVGVYSFLKLYVPKEKPSCGEGISLIVQDYICNASETSPELNLTIENRGLFKVDAAYIRFGNESQKIKEQINKDEAKFRLGRTGINPGQSYSQVYDLSPKSKSLAPLPAAYELEIEPALIVGNTPVACEKSIIVQPIICN